MIIADVHEPKRIVERLRELGAEVEIKRITPGDYVIGGMGFERKTVRDFFSSLIRKRLFDQVLRLKECYPLVGLVVEGDISQLSEYQNPGAFWGAFLAITLDEGIPIFFASDYRQTAHFLYIAERRQRAGGSDYGLRHKPKLMTVEDQQLFFLEGFPNVGQKLARNLLEEFGSLRKVMNAREKDLLRVPMIGRKKARKMTALLDAEYETTQKRID
ncbi:MAG: ERCC4 domain-containing protein [Thermoplasmata archaeon]